MVQRERATIHEVAARAGVSEATVSRALRGLQHVAPETVEQVRRAAAELGYTPSRSAAALATGRARTVSVIVPGVASWFYAAVLEGVDDALRAAGYAVGLVSLSAPDGGRRPLTAAELQAGQAEAHVVIAFELDDDEQALVRATGAPIVTIGGTIDGVRGVGIPEEEAAAMVVEHLASLGHRRIGHIGADREDGLNPGIAAARRDAWAAAVARLGLEDRPEWFGSGAFRIEASRDAALRVLSGAERPTAIFAASDVSAFGVLLAAQQLGLRVPQDLSVAGIDDHPFSAAHGLTTVRQSPRQQGARAAAMLLRELGVRGPVPQASAIELVVRASTGPPA